MQLLVNSQFAFQLCSAFTPSYLQQKKDTDMGTAAALTHTDWLSKHVQPVAHSCCCTQQSSAVYKGSGQSCSEIIRHSASGAAGDLPAPQSNLT